MSIDLNSQEFQYLLRQFDRGDVVLFVGAGFSIDAKNRQKKDPPLGGQLAEILADRCGWNYQGEDLPTVYAQARMHLGSDSLRDVLADLYKDCAPADWQLLVAQLHWYRIYTTNIDDVIENSYRSGAAQILDSITCPATYQDQDQFYEHVQCVHLHGSVLDFSKPLTFTLEEFAGQTAKPNPWYQTLVSNMLSKSFIFVGARLNDSPFYHYLNLRTERESGVRESRAKAFLVSPSISPINRRQFEDQNFVVVDASGEEFFNSIVPVVKSRIPARHDLLKNRYPHQIAAINEGVFDAQSEVLRQFEIVSGDAVPTTPGYRTYFFDGAEPTWDDIRRNTDAKRETTAEFLKVLIEKTEGVRTVILTGQAGSGKSTTIKRLAFELFREGYTVYFSKTAQTLDTEALKDLIASLGSRHIFIFLDDAESHVSSVHKLVRNLAGDSNVTVVLTDRPHKLLPKLSRARGFKPIMLEMPNLNKEDCEYIIGKLEEVRLLGALQGKTREQQLREFLGRSRKQLLVAMKEATSGRHFDAIIEDEYRTLTNDNARMGYAIACLAYIHGAPVRRRHLIACLDGTDIEKANTLVRDLQGVVVSWKGNDLLASPRHRIIANHVITGAAPFSVRKEAIKRYLTQISSEVNPEAPHRRTPEFIAYRGIINFDSMQDLFNDDYEAIEEIYSELKGYYSQDYLFWLQYGRAEVYFDNFSKGENYLNQSLGIRENIQARHYMGVLFLKRALYQENATLAALDAKQGEEILRQQIRDRGDTDPYPYAALVIHKLRYLKKYHPTKFSEELEELKDLAQLGLQKHPLENSMKDAHKEVFRE